MRTCIVHTRAYNCIISSPPSSPHTVTPTHMVTFHIQSHTLSHSDILTSTLTHTYHHPTLSPPPPPHTVATIQLLTYTSSSRTLCPASHSPNSCSIHVQLLTPRPAAHSPSSCSLPVQLLHSMSSCSLHVQLLTPRLAAHSYAIFILDDDFKYSLWIPNELLFDGLPLGSHVHLLTCNWNG